MGKLLDSLRISTRILLGFSLITACIVLVSVIAHWALTTARENLISFRKASDYALEVTDLERDTLDLQRNVQVYSFTGHESVGVTVDERIAEVLTSLVRVEGATPDAQGKALLARMKQHILNYQETFNSAREEVSLRRILVNESIVPIRKNINDYLQGENRSRPATLELEAAFLNADRSFFQYLHDPYLPSVTLALRKLEETASRASLPDDMQSTLSRYQAMVIRVTQATRGYLFLISVVMAGEAQEFRFASTQLKTSVIEGGKPLILNLEQATQHARSITTIVSILALVLGVFLSWIIGRSISTPLGQITTVLNRLAKGDRTAEIPYLNRNDEIGIMSGAANVFKKKSEQTEELLENQKILTEELKQQQLDLERSNEELDQFVYTVSHDLKSPLVTSAGFIGMMKRLVGKGDLDGAISKLTKVEDANKRMSQLISDLLKQSRVGRLDQDKEQVNLKAVSKQLVSVLGPNLERKGIRMEVDEDLPQVYANESRLLQILENTIGNAIKYAGNESEAVIRIGASEKLSDQEDVFFIKDNGPGIPEEYHEKVFGLFQRLDNAREGTGVGLSIVHKAMNFHGGRVWIESKGQNDGCTFWFAFPKKKAE